MRLAAAGVPPVLVIVVGVLGAATVAWMATRSPLLDVDHLVVRGNERAATEEVLEAGGLHRGDPIVWLDVDDAATVDRGAALDTRRAASSGSGQTPCGSRCASVARWRGSTAATGAHWSSTRTAACSIVDAEPPAGLPQLVDVATAGPVGGTITPVEGARVGRRAPRHRADEHAGDRDRRRAGRRCRSHRARRSASDARPSSRAKVRAAVAVLGAPQAAGKTYVDVSAPSSPVAG